MGSKAEVLETLHPQLLVGSNPWSCRGSRGRTGSWYVIKGTGLTAILREVPLMKGPQTSPGSSAPWEGPSLARDVQVRRRMLGKIPKERRDSHRRVRGLLPGTPEILSVSPV